MLSIKHLALCFYAILLCSCGTQVADENKLEDISNDIRMGTYDSVEINTISDSVMGTPAVNLDPDAIKSFYSARYVLRADLARNQNVSAILNGMKLSGKADIKDIDCFWCISFTGPNGAQTDIYFDRVLYKGYWNGNEVLVDQGFKASLQSLIKSLGASGI